MRLAILVKRDGRWVVDEDSEYIFEGKGDRLTVVIADLVAVGEVRAGNTDVAGN